MGQQDNFDNFRKASPSEINPPENGQNSYDNASWILRLLYAPTLTLVQYYLNSKNGSRKTMQNCVLEFSQKHPDAWITAFVIDLLIRLLAILLMVFIFARGIGVISI